MEIINRTSFRFFAIITTSITSLLASGCVTIALSAPTPPREGLIDGATLQTAALEQVVDRVQAGGVLIVSEQHGNLKHHARQTQALTALMKTGRCTVSVGLEFLRWPAQDAAPKYLSGAITEADFLAAVGWGSDSFDNYREQARFPILSGGELRAINAPTDLTRAISRNGLQQLSPELQKQMPPNFELGRASYRKRFEHVMGGHVPPQALDNYFAAQSTWDETMAWQTQSFLATNPTHCLAIIVGDFHAAWGGGLPDRLRARGVQNVVVISQVETEGMTDSELQTEVEPQAGDGTRADAVWLSSKAISSPF